LPIIGHVAVALAASRVAAQRDPGISRHRTALTLAWISLIPDADLLIPGRSPRSPFGHRGASHSLVGALLVTAFAARFRRRHPRWVASPGILAAVAVSHALLDTFSGTRTGVAWFWPLSRRRFLSPRRPLPRAPGARELLRPRTLGVLIRELGWYAPLLAYGLTPTSAALSARPRDSHVPPPEAKNHE